MDQRALEDLAYERALDELDADRVDKPTWARAFAESNGDHDRAKALYISSRVQSMMQLANRSLPLGQRPIFGLSGRFVPTIGSALLYPSVALVFAGIFWLKSVAILGIGIALFSSNWFLFLEAAYRSGSIGTGGIGLTSATYSRKESPIGYWFLMTWMSFAGIALLIGGIWMATKS